MADNVAITPGTGATVAADDIGGVLHQRVKISVGADGAAADLAPGSAAAAASLPVTQSTEDVARAGIVTETAPATDTASSGLNGRLQRIAQRITSFIALVPASLGSKAAASAFAVTDSTEDIARQGIITETAPASDTASSGLNGRLQRIAQHLSLLVTEAQSTDPVVVSGGSYSASVTFTPAAASHVAGDCNGAAGEFTTMGLSAGRVMITSAELMIFGATVEATAWRLYLYNITPPSAYADDTAWDILTGDRASYLGYVDLGTAVDLGGTQWVETHAIQKQVKLAGTSLFGYLVNLTTLTPANVAHTVTLHAVGL